MTACAAERYGRHDYSQPAHNTPDDPRDADDYPDGRGCHAQSSDISPCERAARYEIVIYQIGSHEWIRMTACAPCAATLRRRHRDLGPGGSDGIARIRDHPDWQPGATPRADRL
jgi:hypothetical protein